jgi:hypothetical protein
MIHNHEVAGSCPALATVIFKQLREYLSCFFCFSEIKSQLNTDQAEFRK